MPVHSLGTIMSSSTPIRFLLDENIRVELVEFLSKREIDFAIAKKSSGDNTLANTSIEQERVVVTNDIDFSKMRKGQVFGVVWLRLPQNDPKLLLEKFGEMLDDDVRCADSLVTLERDKRRVVPLATRIPLGKKS